MTVLLCPGQGAQYVGMGKEIADRWPEAQAMFDRADEALGMELAHVLFEGPESQIHRTDICQPGILTVTAAILAVLEARGLVKREELTYAAGLSLGEYTAHYVAGTLGFEDAVRLVRRRGQYMQEASDTTPSGMAAVMGVELERIEEICAAIRAGGGVVVVANLNAPGQVVVSGEAGALEQCGEQLTAAGARRFVPLTVAGAFHSPVMQPAADRLAEDLATVTFADPTIPVIANAIAEPVTTGEAARDMLTRQIVAPVLFERSLKYVVDAGATAFVEPGPGRTLAGFLRKIDRKLRCAGYETADQIESA